MTLTRARPRGFKLQGSSHSRVFYNRSCTSSWSSRLCTASRPGLGICRPRFGSWKYVCERQIRASFQSQYCWNQVVGSSKSTFPAEQGQTLFKLLFKISSRLLFAPCLFESSLGLFAHLHIVFSPLCASSLQIVSFIASSALRVVFERLHIVVPPLPAKALQIVFALPPPPTSSSFQTVFALSSFPASSALHIFFVPPFPPPQQFLFQL